MKLVHAEYSCFAAPILPPSAKLLQRFGQVGGTQRAAPHQPAWRDSSRLRSCEDSSQVM